MATNVRVYTLTLGTAGALVASTTSAEVFATLASAKSHAEEVNGPIKWRASDSTRSSWAVGVPTARPSAYTQVVAIAPSAKGVAEVVEELRRLDTADIEGIRAAILARQNRPAPTDTEEQLA